MTWEATMFGSLLAGRLVADIRLLTTIILVCGAMDTVLLPIMDIRGKPTTHTAITTATNIHIVIPIGIRTIITAMTCGLGR